MLTNVLPSEQAGVVATIDPDVYTANAYSSDYVDMADFEMLMAVVSAGTLGSSATLDGKLEQATTSGGGGVKDITGKAITQLTQGGSDDSDKQAIINVRGSELDIAGGFRFVRLTVTVGTATSDVSGLILGFGPKHGPASDNDLASVAEIVA